MTDESGKEKDLNWYERKQADRQERYEELADKANTNAQSTLTQAKCMAEIIPFGQPILVGHHSEKRDRNYRNRIENTFRRAFEEHDKAQHYSEKAAAVGSGGISSDDPDAVEKLQSKLEELQTNQTIMKAANRIIRSKKAASDKVAELTELGLSKAHAEPLLEPDELGNTGFAPYQLQNNNASIRRVKARIAELAEQEKREDVEVVCEGYTYREDTVENRVMFIFPGKPEDEIRTILKSHGFKWSPNRDAWVRQLNNQGIFNGELVRKALDERS